MWFHSCGKHKRDIVWETLWYRFTEWIELCNVFPTQFRLFEDFSKLPAKKSSLFSLNRYLAKTKTQHSDLGAGMRS